MSIRSPRFNSWTLFLIELNTTGTSEIFELSFSNSFIDCIMGSKILITIFKLFQKPMPFVSRIIALLSLFNDKSSVEDANRVKTYLPSKTDCSISYIENHLWGLGFSFQLSITFLMNHTLF